MPSLPARLLFQWGAVPGPGESWLESLAPLQYVAYGLRDTTGRPLGELNAPESARVGLEAELRPCPYPDSRAGLPMNVTALRLVRDHWPWVLESAEVLRDAWSAHHPPTPTPIDLPHLWSFSAAVSALPLFLLRTGGATEDTIPAGVSGLFKVMQGVFVTTWRQWMADPERTDAPTVDEVLNALLAGQVLHNLHVGRVCPAPVAMIRELLSVCMAAPSPARPGDARALLTYGSAYAASSLEKWSSVSSPSAATRVVERHRDSLVGWTAGAPARSVERITALQQVMCRACGVPGPTGAFDPAWVRRT